MSFYTYILYSQSLDVFYIGATKDIEQRLNYHNAGYEKFTSKGIPWGLLWFTSKNTRTEAFKLERKLKNLSRMRLIAFMIKYDLDLKNSAEFFSKFEP
jgi:putative endonuclease